LLGDRRGDGDLRGLIAHILRFSDQRIQKWMRWFLFGNLVGAKAGFGGK
jgi:hypothetical protein